MDNLNEIGSFLAHRLGDASGLRIVQRRSMPGLSPAKTKEPRRRSFSLKVKNWFQSTAAVGTPDYAGPPYAPPDTTTIARDSRGVKYNFKGCNNV